MTTKALHDTGAARSASSSRELSISRTISIAGAFADPATRPGVLTNIRDDDPMRERLYMDTLKGANFTADEMIGQQFGLTRFLCTPATWVSEETGESRDGVRTTLIDPDGQTVAFGSDGIVRALEMLCSLFGGGPWHPPLIVKIVQIQTAAKRRVLTLEYVGRGNAQKP